MALCNLNSLDIDFSPTGKEFVTGSFDKTIRLFKVDQGKSYNIYHAKRMQKVFAVQWTSDDKYILSGSDDTNVRIWKARASEKLGNTSEREKTQNEYREHLLEKFKYNDEIRKIKKSHVPKYVITHKNKKHAMTESKYRKMDNMRVNNEAVFEEPLPETKRKIVKTE